MAAIETGTGLKLVGFAGQGLFFTRMLLQWIASERRGRSVLPPAFWWLSLGGSALMLVYAAATRDPVFLLGPLVNLFIYGRNLMLMRAGEPAQPLRRRVLLPLAAGLLAFMALALHATLREGGLLEFGLAPGWLLLGFAGQALWIGRFIVQWWISERRGQSVLPAPFWWVSLVGSVLLLTYALWRGDVVFIAAYALNPIPAVRNLVLIRREGRAGAGAGKPGATEGGA
ncbi:MAG: hypothetical protein KatS3mg102_2897 [Planctomycetota bacterium]|nr:MAG: hypothetical protein KatS3mg102_2897 [Planctomycetota bacterium]